MDKESMIQKALEAGFSHAGIADVQTLKTRPEVRDMCAADKCHAYDRTWTCPPGCGTIEECGERMRQYDFGILCQTTAELEDSMDYEGMMKGMEDQNVSCEKFFEILKKEYRKVLPLTTAGCDICKQCTYPDSPCRFPDKARSPMEGYGLLVSQVCLDNGLKYYYGKDTVTYTAMFLIKE